MFKVQECIILAVLNQTNMTNTIAQNNLYRVFDSMGRPTDIYVTASNIKDACKQVKAVEAKDRSAFAKKAGSYYKVKRGYNGGVRG